MAREDFKKLQERSRRKGVARHFVTSFLSWLQTGAAVTDAANVGSTMAKVSGIASIVTGSAQLVMGGFQADQGFSRGRELGKMADKEADKSFEKEAFKRAQSRISKGGWA